MLRRFGLLSVLVALPLLVGCFRGLAYPEFLSCPGTTLPPTSDEVFAVREYVCLEQSGLAVAPSTEKEQHTATRLELADGKVPAQRAMGLSYWWDANWGDTPTSESRRHSVMLKLYRRGYKTIVLRAAEPAPPRDWKPISTPDEQAVAIRDFAYAPQKPKNTAGKPMVVTLAPGSAAERHKQVLLFIAAEFERVASLYPAGSAGDISCRKDAEDVRALAAR